MEYELKSNLALKQNYKSIHAAFLSSRVHLVPNEFLSAPYDRYLQLHLDSPKKFSILETPLDKIEATLVYGLGVTLKELLLPLPLFDDAVVTHSGKVFIDSIPVQENETSFHINLHNKYMEAAVFKDGNLVFYNTFEALTQEDFLFYSLYILDQLQLDPNEIKTITYGDVLPKSKYFILLEKYIRYIEPIDPDEDRHRNYTLYKLFECE